MFSCEYCEIFKNSYFFSSVGIIARPAVKMPWAIKNSYFAERLRTIVSEVSNLCLKSPAPNIACGFSISWNFEESAFNIRILETWNSYSSKTS